MDQQTPVGSSTTTRRTLIRGAAWATPVVLTTVAAPAFALSAGPLTIAAAQTGPSGQKLIGLTFTGGTGNVSVTNVLRSGTTIPVSPTTVSANGGMVTGANKDSYVAGASYQVTYVYGGVTYVRTATAT
jgi:hypothetical protein